MVDGSRVVRLVDGNGSVDDRGRDGLLINDGLDVLVDVVVDALARHGGAGRRRVRGVVGGARVAVLGGIALEVLPGVGVAAMLEGLVLYGHHVLGVLLRENLLGLDGLDAGLVMLLVHVLVDGGGDILVLVREDVLLGGGAADVLVDGGLVLSITGKEFSGGLLSSLHCV